MILPIYSRRWGHVDDYTVEITPQGWKIFHQAFEGECTPNGGPVLFQGMDNDIIRYPKAELAQRMSDLWQRATSQQLTEEAIQEELSAIGAWLKTKESKALPKKKSQR